MSDLIKEVEAGLKKRLNDALEKAVKNGEMKGAFAGDFAVERPKDKSFGDYSTNIALVSAKAFGINPREIAQKIINNLDLDDSYLELPKIAGAGFINFTLKDIFYQKTLENALALKDDYGKSDSGDGRKVMIEFVSANPTGPMHIGNARGGAIGDSLAAAFQYAGYEVSREFYVNDAGNQIEKFADSLEARYMQKYLGDDMVDFPEDGYQGGDITARAEEFAELQGDKYVLKDSSERKKALVSYSLKKNIAELKSDLEQYRIVYDNWFMESSLHGTGGEIEKAITLLENNDMTYWKDGALWYRSTENGAEKDDVLIRQNGVPTYFAADIAYHINKLNRGFYRMINVWGADHHGHIARLKGAITAAGYDGSKLDVALMQMVRLLKDGETVKVSKRTGKAITLKTLLLEVPLDAARFFFNMRDPGTHLEFDLDLAISESSENPVYYVQYAHARICSILRRLEVGNLSAATNNISNRLDMLREKEEKDLIVHIALFSKIIEETIDELDPSKITKYALETAALFHKFYNACRVGVEDKELMYARVALIAAAKITLKNLLGLLKISCPEVM